MSGLLQDKILASDHLPWLSGLRQKGRDAFEKQGIPTPKTENWKYTKPRALNADDFVMLDLIEAEDHHCSCGCNCGGEHHHHDHCQHRHPFEVPVPFEAYQFHFFNGQFIPFHPDLPKGVEVMTLLEAVEHRDDAKPNLGKLLDLDSYPFAALNTAYLEEGLFICIEKGIKLEKPIMIVNHSNVGEENIFSNLRNLIIVENGAELELIEYYNYSGEPKSRYFINIVNEIFVGRNAVLNHYKYQNDAFKATHIALNLVQVKEYGKYQNLCLQKGADLGRNEVVVNLKEEGAHADVSSAYKMFGWATIDTTTVINHLSPHTTSEQLVKGVVGGDARGVFQGKIHIAPDAQKTQGYQLHKSLLLSDSAEIDVKPELEIFADDVKCSHGAASGELDEEQLFYMQSRGIGEDEAKQMLIEAFLDDVLLKAKNAEIKNWLKIEINKVQE